MLKWFPRIRIITFIIIIGLMLLPVCLRAEGITLLADFEYYYTMENTTEKETGVVTDTEFSRVAQLYQIDFSRFVYPNVYFNLGSFFEQNGTDISTISPPMAEESIDSRETSIRPYLEINLNNPLYKGGLAYRKRVTDSSSTLQADETLTVDEYNANLNWRPVDLPLLNISFQRLDLRNEPLTFDATRDTLSLISNYDYRDFYFHYLYNSLDNFDNLENEGSLSQTHNSGVRYGRGFNYKNNRFDVQAGVKYIYNSIEFTGIGGLPVDRPADSPGSPFYILNDITPTDNELFELTSVDAAQPLTDVNIGRDGGLSPVSAGLSFNTPTEVETVYIQLSSDQDQFPNLASEIQVASVTPSFSWQFYSSDNPVELNWTLQPLASVRYNSIDNRFEVRLAAPVLARHIKITTTPLTLTAPGEIRYDSISAFTTIDPSSGDEPEIFSQYYNYGLQWKPNSITTMGYEGFYRNQETQPEEEEFTSLTNSLYFRHAISPVFSTFGRVSRTDRGRSSPGEDEDEVEHFYSLALRGNYLETLNQTLIYSGSSTDSEEGTTSSDSLVLRTNADLYQGWSMNLDLGYGINTLLSGADQTVKTVRIGTIVEPNKRLNFNLDYTIFWTEETNQIDSIDQFGTFQVLWAITDTMSMFYRYNFRKQEGASDISTYENEFNINWAPFPDGTMQFSIGYNETSDFADQEIKTLSPTLTWEVARGIFLDLRYSTGTIDTPTETSNLDSLIAKLRIYY